MKELIILIVMMFPEYGRYPDSIEVNGLHGKPLSFTTVEKCADHVHENFDALKDFAMSVYPDAVTIKRIVCVEKNKQGLTGA